MDEFNVIRINRINSEYLNLLRYIYKMNTLIVNAVIEFFENQESIFKTGMIVDFRIREGMFNSGKIDFINKEYAKSGDINIFAQITFAYKDLVQHYIQKDVYFFW